MDYKEAIELDYKSWTIRKLSTKELMIFNCGVGKDSWDCKEGELFCFFDDAADVGNLLSGSSAFSKTSLNIWKFMVHVSLKPGLENFEHYFTSVSGECNCAVVWAFFGIAFLWDWNENLTFSSPVATAEFSKFVDILSAALSQHHLSGFGIAQLEVHHFH